MTCERYWRDGIVLVERGLDDPHRDGCADCTLAHASRQELIDALPLIGADYPGDPDWQAKVWRRIDEQRRPAPVRWRWQLAGALAAACAIALWVGIGRERPGEARPAMAIIPGEVAMRSGSVTVGARLRVEVDETSEVWIYRGGHLVFRCRAREVAEGCTPDSDGMVAQFVLLVPGKYLAIAVKTPPSTLPHGELDDDRAALISAGIEPDEYPVAVH
ncbi:MAG TPA: hypothetical protein VGD37_04180 [Kofleriaceae bacterium]